MGGTFDPVHRGHVRLATEARDRLRLDRVLLAPVAAQPLKSDAAEAGWQERMQMVELAIAGEPKLEVSALDAARANNRPNYTVDAINELRRELPPEAQIWLLLGVDAFQNLQRWHRVDELLQLVDIAVASRPGYVLPRDGNALLPFLPAGARLLGSEQVGLSTAFVFLSGGTLVRVAELGELEQDISATQLRSDLRDGKSWDWLPPRVAEYVRRHGLYRTHE